MIFPFDCDCLHAKFVGVDYASFGGGGGVLTTTYFVSPFFLYIRYSRGDFMRGTVLVFLPGLPEIKNMQDILVNNAHYRNLG